MAAMVMWVSGSPARTAASAGNAMTASPSQLGARITRRFGELMLSFCSCLLTLCLVPCPLCLVRCPSIVGTGFEFGTRGLRAPGLEEGLVR